MPSSDLAQAATDIKWLGARFKGLLAAADALDKLGSIENAIAEANGRLADLAKQERDAKTRAMQIIAEAQQEAAVIAKKAAAEREIALQSVNDEAAKIDDASKLVMQETSEQKANLYTVEKAIATKNDEHTQVLARIENAKAEHARIIKIIDDAKAKFS